ncbi:hypothetical protein A2970_01425 [Candidatus Roizmanbacteria bacterium RIFCSPLOWO2_01_FULL_44_13]|uniref:Nudix hydrolase domain-containing protein n=1 Tax=Candidatus Roizmanbacteria bacterium RIFCSPLOWO2_01_FULL_44_13 TaxID=1802069 RepID=A0A1F7JAM2_9BACT|nr:MAG: hypothetical protein A2970_01425 [Candidatus Roizmanbacteria bacterium RIFCSPLOWO2_01_FULL_44_13]
MKNYQEKIKHELLKFKKLGVDKKIYERFLKKISSTDRLTKEVNLDEHICAFFVPINRKTKSIYLTHHIKADDWIPPGGHIKLNEYPIETVIREFEEELSHKITKDQIEIFNLSVKDVRGNPRSPCLLHFDFWYLVDVPKINFNFLKKEFYDAYWHSFDEALGKIKTPKYNQIIRILKEVI